MKRLRALVKGRVQGVGFRYSVVHEAHKHSLFGWVRNNWDGSVEVVAEGSESSIKRLLAWLYKGPSLSRVDNVDFDISDCEQTFRSFDIKY